MKYLLLAAILYSPLFAQNPQRWSSTTGDVSLSGAAYAATIQQPANNASQVILEQAVVYCSVGCSVSISANGAAATTTAGTIQALLPNNLGATAPMNFFTASNVGAGTAQGGIIHVPAGAAQSICLNTSCGQTQTVSLNTAGTNQNYTISVASITGTVNITFFMETR